MPPTPMNRQRQPDLLEQLLVRHGAVMVAEVFLDERSLVCVVVLAQGGDHGLDVHHDSLETKAGPPEKVSVAPLSALG